MIILYTIATIVALNLLLTVGLIVGYLRNPHSDRNTIAWARKHMNDPVPYVPLTDDELADWADLSRRLEDQS